MDSLPRRCAADRGHCARRRSGRILPAGDWTRVEHHEARAIAAAGLQPGLAAVAGSLARRRARRGARGCSIPSPAGPGSMSPHLALTPSGGVVMSWLEPTGEKTPRPEVRHARRRPVVAHAAGRGERRLVRQLGRLPVGHAHHGEGLGGPPAGDAARRHLFLRPGAGHLPGWRRHLGRALHAPHRRHAHGARLRDALPLGRRLRRRVARRAQHPAGHRQGQAGGGRRRHDGALRPDRLRRQDPRERRDRQARLRLLRHRRGHGHGRPRRHLAGPHARRDPRHRRQPLRERQVAAAGDRRQRRLADRRLPRERLDDCGPGPARRRGLVHGAEPAGARAAGLVHRWRPQRLRRRCWWTRAP